MSPDPRPNPAQRPRLPHVAEVVTIESFGQLALAATRPPGRWLVLTALLAGGVSTGELFAAALEEDLQQRIERLILWEIHLTITVPSWTHLAYAVVEQHPEGNVAMVVILPRERRDHPFV